MPSLLIIFSVLHSGGKIFDVDDQKVEHCPPTPLNGKGSHHVPIAQFFLNDMKDFFLEKMSQIEGKIVKILG